MKWDGSNLGDITSHIEAYNGIFIKLKNESEIMRIYKFEDCVPLIADELKLLFGIIKIGRHRAIINGTDVLLCRVDGIEYEFQYMPGMSTDEIQRSYVFRWALGLVSKGESSLCLRKYKSGIVAITSFIDRKIDYDEDKVRGSKITQTAIKKWFESPTKIAAILNQFFKKEDLFKLRCEIDSVIRRIDPSLSWWTMAIINRIQSKLD